MSYKGSIIIKRTDLLNMIDNAKHLSEYENRKNAEDGTDQHYLFGQLVMLERILEDDEWKHNHNNFMHKVWDTYHSPACKPAEIFEWLFNPTLLPHEESAYLFKLLNEALERGYF